MSKTFTAIVAAALVSLSSAAVRADIVPDQSRISVSAPQEPNLDQTGKPFAPPHTMPQA